MNAEQIEAVKSMAVMNEDLFIKSKCDKSVQEQIDSELLQLKSAMTEEQRELFDKTYNEAAQEEASRQLEVAQEESKKAIAEIEEEKRQNKTLTTMMAVIISVVVIYNIASDFI